MPEIPKSARELLARQTAPEAHPSPDLLNAYAEQALSGVEKDKVVEHLAACANCRDVVFLASQSQEQEQEVELPLVATATRAQQSMDAMPLPAMPASAQPPMAPKPRPVPKRNWWKWAATAAAVIVVGAALLVERPERLSSPADQVAMSRVPASAAPTAPVPDVSAALKSQDEESKSQSSAILLTPPSKKAASAEAAEAVKRYEAELALRERREMAGSLARSDAASNLEKPRANAPAPTPLAKAVAPSAHSSNIQVTSAAPLVQADNADLSANPPSFAKSLTGNSSAGALANLEMSRRSVAASPRWRISDDGHLEHTVGPSTWTRVLSAEPVTFRVVSTIGNNVWAGGNGGELWHSSDGGQHWNKVALGETGAITTIHFDSALQGSLTTDAGSTWTTSDAGLTWSKQ